MILLHKPVGHVTTAATARRTVVDIVPSTRVVPIARLDVDTTGALLLTNDGALARTLAHPKYGVEKTYVAEVEGEPTEDVMKLLRAGIELDDGITAPAKARLLGRDRIELTIHEGRNHQVKRMLEAVGHPVRRLHRSAYAGLTLGGLSLASGASSSPPGLSVYDEAVLRPARACLARRRSAVRGARRSCRRARP